MGISHEHHTSFHARPIHVLNKELSVLNPYHHLTDLQIAKIITSSGRINAAGCRIPLRSNWNIRLFRSLCTCDADRHVLTFLTYGWPLNRSFGLVAKTFYNHASANRFPQHINKYLCKELQEASILGPFATSPFAWETTGVSPMSTRPKKETDKRRVIVDLSWPPNSMTSVNALIPKDKYLDSPIKLTYPTIDRLCTMAVSKPPGRKGWKKDMSRAFRQLPLDAIDWSFLGVSWMGALFFDKAAVMGCRSAPYICQETTTAITRFMRVLSYIIANYIDDFMSVDTEVRAWAGFTVLGRLLRDLGVKEAEDKSCPPSDMVEFLGILFNLIKLTLHIPETKILEVKELLNKWTYKSHCRKSELQSIAGKLQFFSLVVRPGRPLITRIYDEISICPEEGVHQISLEVEKDLLWWTKFLDLYNGTSIMWMAQTHVAQTRFATDSSLTGMGGQAQGCFWFAEIPAHLQQEPIATLELWAVIVSLKKWAYKYRGGRFKIKCDNQVVVAILNSGRSHVHNLQCGLREVCYILATNECEMVVEYIPTEENVIPDKLSRLQAHDQVDEILQEMGLATDIQEEITPELFTYSQDW